MFCFLKTVGLKVNYDKSSLIDIGCDIVAVETMATIIGCRVEKLPTIFLGMPIGINMGKLKLETAG